MRKRTWTLEKLQDAVRDSFSYRKVLERLGLRPAGGNYDQLKRYIAEFKLNIDHFRGRGWSAGLRGIGKPRKSLKEILVRKSTFQTYKLKQRLFAAGLKRPECEQCGWAEQTPDGYLPLELDHTNGDGHDNRLKNLRILCPNCHSLQPTHRGRNIRLKRMRRGGEIGRRTTLKMS